MIESHEPQSQSPSQSQPQFRSDRNPTEQLGTFRSSSASFRPVPNDLEAIGTLPNLSERNENHVLTVREAARMFEAAGVARTERSIVKWCRRIGNEVPRLDSYYDPNERKYFITPQSVELAIAEERAKAAKVNTPFEPAGSVPNPSDQRQELDRESQENKDAVNSLEVKIRDLQITNLVKNQIIDRLEKEREAFTNEREEYIEKLMSFNHRIGQLETQLLQLAEPRGNQSRKLEVRRDAEDEQNVS